MIMDSGSSDLCVFSVVCALGHVQDPLLGILHLLTIRPPVFLAGSLALHVQRTFADRHTPLTPVPRPRSSPAVRHSTLHMDRATPTGLLARTLSRWPASPFLIRLSVCFFFLVCNADKHRLTFECIGVVTSTSANLISYPLSGLMGLAWKSIASSGATPFWQTLAASGDWDSPEMGVYLKRYRGDNTASQIETDGGQILFG